MGGSIQGKICDLDDIPITFCVTALVNVCDIIIDDIVIYSCVDYVHSARVVDSIHFGWSSY